MSKFDVVPVNKHVVLEPLKEDERVGKEGIIIAPGNALQKQHRLAKVVAIDTECPEAKCVAVGDLVFYDHIGAVEGRVGNQGFTIVKILNIMSVMKQKPAQRFDEILNAVGETLEVKE